MWRSSPGQNATVACIAREGWRGRTQDKVWIRTTFHAWHPGGTIGRVWIIVTVGGVLAPILPIGFVTRLRATTLPHRLWGLAEELGHFRHHWTLQTRLCILYGSPGAGGGSFHPPSNGDDVITVVCPEKKRVRCRPPILIAYRD